MASGKQALSKFQKSKVDTFLMQRLNANDLPILYIDNFEIIIENVTKFLGIYIDENLIWK